MIGRQEIVTNRYFTLDELEAFMKEHWNTADYNEFERGRPTALSVDEYVMLPATARYLIIIHTKQAGGLFNKENKVILTTVNTPQGASESLLRGIPTSSLIFGGIQIHGVMSAEKERKGPAEEILQKYASYLKQLLQEAGYLKQ